MEEKEKEKELQEALEALEDVANTPEDEYKHGLEYEYALATFPVTKNYEAAAILAHIESLKAEIKMLKGANAAWQKENKRLAEIETQANEDTEIMRHQQQRIDELEQRQRILWKEG